MIFLPSRLFALAFLPLYFSFIQNSPVLRINKRQLLASVAMPWTVGPTDLCGLDESKGQQQHQSQCNTHNKLFQCTCTLPLQKQFAHPCQAVLPRVDNPKEQLLTIGFAFPLVAQFTEDPERIFLEDLEIFTFIPQEAIVIYRRGCSPDHSAYEFQFGILESTCRHSEAQLRTVSPRIFLSNPFFMNENALKVAYIRAG